MSENSGNPLISVVVPVYGCPEALWELYERLKKSLSTISDQFEIILVNDACPYNSWAEILKIAQQDSKVVGINLSRNFGQHHAITAGLDYCSGEWIVVMDCDLQDRPEEIPKLFRCADEGYDAVKGRRSLRQDSFLKRLGSTAFYAVFSYLTDQKPDKSIANYGIYSRRFIKSVLKLREQHRSFGLFVNWVGFTHTAIDIEHGRRELGKSSYTFRKMLDLAIDNIIAYSNKPLRLCIKFGFVMAFFAILYAFWMIINYFFFSVIPEGYTSLIVSIYFLSGLIMGSVGMVGLYVSKIFTEVKGRPLYIVEEVINPRNVQDD